MSIEVRHLSKTFGSFTALRDVSVRVESGELVALLGPSGSGKTTLLRIIAGLEFPDHSPDGSTQILFDGQDVANRPSGQRGVGLVFQHYALFKHMTVFENVAFGLRVKTRKERPTEAKIKARVLELLDLVQLSNFHSRYPSQLSGGQRQRVALARALAVQPKVLLLDEPFGALDARVRSELRRWLRTLHEQIHVTGILVTHDQEEALEVADRVVVMNHAKVEQIGSPDEVFHHPSNEFVMRFLGSVNLFHGRTNQGGAVPSLLTPGENTGSAQAGAGKVSRVLVRPHELEVSLTADGSGSVPATIKRINSAGSTVRLELASGSGDRFDVELPHERFSLLSLSNGQAVFVRPRQMRVFAESGDYSI